MSSSNRKKVLMLQALHDDAFKMFEARDDVEVEVLTDISEENILAHIEGVHGLSVRQAKVSRKVIEAADSLEIVARHGVGYDSVDTAALSEKGVPLAIAPRANAPSVSEMVMMYFLALAKEMPHYTEMLRKDKKWDRRVEFSPFDIEGRTLLIIGIGRIGSKLVKRALGFDMRVLGYDPYIDQSIIRDLGAEPVSDLHAVLNEVDCLSVNCPLNDETRGIIGKEELASLRPGALVVNCARGGIIDETAIIEAVRSGHVFGAGFDVFDGEPPKPDHPFFDEPRIFITPHSAGMSREAVMRSSVQVAENILAAFDGKLDPNVVVNKDVL